MSQEDVDVSSLNEDVQLISVEGHQGNVVILHIMIADQQNTQ